MGILRRRRLNKIFGKLIHLLCFASFNIIATSENTMGENVHAFIGGIFSSKTGASYLAAELAISDTIKLQQASKDLPIFTKLFPNLLCGDEEALEKEMMSAPDVRIWLAGCQEDCLILAELTHFHNRTNTIILCYSITALPFEASRQFKNLYSLESSALSIAHTYAKLIVRCNWDKILVIYQNDNDNNDKYVKIADYLIRTMQTAETEIGMDNFPIYDDPLEVAQYIENTDPTVIVSLCDAATARWILCESYNRQAYGKKYIWMFPGPYEFEWYKPKDYENMGCSMQVMEEVVNGHLTAKTLNWNYNVNITTSSGWSVSDFKRRLNKQLEGAGDGIRNTDYDEAALAYDAVWASVLSVREAIKQYEGTGRNYTLSNYADLNIAMENVSFLGISGDFRFNSERGRSIINSVVEMDIYVKNKYEPFGHHIYRTNQWKFPNSQVDSCTSFIESSAPTTYSPTLTSENVVSVSPTLVSAVATVKSSSSYALILLHTITLLIIATHHIIEVDIIDW